MKIKFCGIRRLEDVAFCNELQPEYLGMILSSGFRRTISPETAEQLVKAKSRSIAAVGVFVNETPEHIAQVLKQVPLDVIQLHGSETAEIVSGVRWRTGLPVWKAVQGSLPPMNADRSTPAVNRIWVTIEVVVVLPWVPATQMALSYQLVTIPSSSLRSSTGTPLALAAISSGLSAMIAAVCTIRSAPSIFSARCPRYTGMPMSRTACRVSVSLLSEPVR